LECLATRQIGVYRRERHPTGEVEVHAERRPTTRLAGCRDRWLASAVENTAGCAGMVRERKTRLEPRLRHKNQKIMASGPEMELPLARERQAAAASLL
jgi:hypothetical protein